MPEDAGTESGGYKLELTGPDMSLKRPVTKEVAEKIVMLVFAGGKGVRDLAETTTGEKDADVEIQGDTAVALIKKYRANTNPKKIVALGIHFKRESRMTFTPNDVQGGFETIGESPPRNLPRDLKRTVRKGWIAPKVGQRDVYFVTRDGQDALKVNFASGRGARGRKRRSRKKDSD